MPIPVYDTTAFVGQIALSYDSFAKADYDAAIEQLYPDLLRGFIGAEAYEDIDNASPLSAEWQLFFDGGYYTDTAGRRRYCEGFTKASQYMLYLPLIRDSGWVNTTTGNVVNVNENSSQQLAGNLNAAAVNRYNAGVNFLRTVWCYVNETAYFEQYDWTFPYPEYTL